MINTIAMSESDASLQFQGLIVYQKKLVSTINGKGINTDKPILANNTW